MDATRYNSLRRLAGAHAAMPLPDRFPIDELGSVRASAAVYLVTDALDRIVYVGSVFRPGKPSAISARVREHLRNPVKRLVWHWVWVLPLAENTPERIVRLIEGAVGADLTPTLNHRLPAI